jgi:hypothetical protein
VELSNSELIRSLMAGFNSVDRIPHRDNISTSPRPARVGRRQRCRCGQCRECVDNARWERIFAEKFADPNYYTRSVVRAESPLRSC